MNVEYECYQLFYHYFDSRISNALARACVQFENMCNLSHSEDHCKPLYVNAPWTDLVIACVEFRLQKLYTWQASCPLTLSQRSLLVCGVYFTSMAIFLLTLAFYHFFWSRSPRIL